MRRSRLSNSQDLVHGQWVAMPRRIRWSVAWLGRVEDVAGLERWLKLPNMEDNRLPKALILLDDRLEKVRASNGKTIARCPACAEAGEDKDGKHLAIFADGRFACVTHQGDREHRRRIFELAGIPDDDAPPPRVPGSAPKKSAEVVNWPVNCDRLAKDEAALSRLAAWRGWTADYSRELASAGVIGMHDGRVCFPVADAQGVVIGRHVFQWPDMGRRKGVVCAGEECAARDRRGIAGRRAGLQRDRKPVGCAGAAACARLARRGLGSALRRDTRHEHQPDAATLWQAWKRAVWMQHDEPKAEGKTPPAEEWLSRCMALMPDAVRDIKRVDVAAGFKDWNDVCATVARRKRWHW